MSGQIRNQASQKPHRDDSNEYFQYNVISIFYNMYYWLSYEFPWKYYFHFMVLCHYEAEYWFFFILRHLMLSICLIRNVPKNTKTNMYTSRLFCTAVIIFSFLELLQTTINKTRTYTKTANRKQYNIPILLCVQIAKYFMVLRRYTICITHKNTSIFHFLFGWIDQMFIYITILFYIFLWTK